jgi:ferrous iron transport protein A
METDWISLNKLKPGEEAIIRGFGENNSVEEYLMELGLMIGTPISLIKSAPLGDPIEIKVRGYFLSIRRSEAQFILVEKIEAQRGHRRRRRGRS